MERETERCNYTGLGLWMAGGTGTGARVLVDEKTKSSWKYKEAFDFLVNLCFHNCNT